MVSLAAAHRRAARPVAAPDAAPAAALPGLPGPADGHRHGGGAHSPPPELAVADSGAVRARHPVPRAAALAPRAVAPHRVPLQGRERGVPAPLLLPALVEPGQLSRQPRAPPPVHRARRPRPGSDAAAPVAAAAVGGPLRAGRARHDRRDQGAAAVEHGPTGRQSVAAALFRRPSPRPGRRRQARGAVRLGALRAGRAPAAGRRVHRHRPVDAAAGGDVRPLAGAVAELPVSSRPSTPACARTWRTSAAAAARSCWDP